MFDADRPIQTAEQDRLGRTTFAKYLARCILDHHSTESLVIGLYGGWGTGKTSIINLTLEELRFAASNMLDEEMPIILNFSPWSYSGQNQLIYSFFRRLSSEIRRSSHLENPEKIIPLLELYISFFTREAVPKSLRPKHSWLFRLLKPTITREETYGWESGQDLTQVKAELNEILRKQKHKFIIMIDNIARMEDREIKEIFQIVKSIGDFANTIYVLSIDKEHVTSSINHIYGGGGIDFLEKVVQLPFEIPPISSQDLEILLLDKLQKIIALSPEKTWNSDYWADLYYSTLKYFFKNCRDITRYINTLSFSYPRVKEVVNPVDFFAITAFQMFTPLLYEGIEENKDLFTDLITKVYPFDKKKLSEDKARCDEILNRDKNISRDILLPALIRLFPRLRSIYESNVLFYHSEAIARKNYRICSADLFDVYFRLTIPNHSISDKELHAILSIIPDEEGFALALLRLNQDNRIEKFLSALDNRAIFHIPLEYIPNLIDALMDSADLFPDSEKESPLFNTPMRVHRILGQLIHRITSEEKRFEIYKHAIQKAINSLYIIIHELNLQSEQHNEEEDTIIPIELRDFSPDHLNELKKYALEKIHFWATHERLSEHPKLLPILYAWKAWENEIECQQYVSHLVEEDKGLLAFLCAALKKPIDETIVKLEKNTNWEKYLKNVQDFIPISLITPHARKMFEDISFEKLREREQLALLIFLDLAHVKTTKIFPKTTV